MEFCQQHSDKLARGLSQEFAFFNIVAIRGQLWLNSRQELGSWQIETVETIETIVMGVESVQ